MTHGPWLHPLLLWFPLMSYQQVCVRLRTHTCTYTHTPYLVLTSPPVCLGHVPDTLSMLSAEPSSPSHLENLLETRLRSRMKPHYWLWLTFSLFVLFFSPLPAPFCHRPIMLYQIPWPLEQSRRWIRCTLLLNVNNHSLTSTSEDDTLSAMHADLPR